MRRWLVIMAKAPRAGAVKSRLAGEIGVAEATRFYRVALTGLIRRLAPDPRWTTLLAVTPDGAVDAPHWPAGVPRIAQGPGDLGARMQRVMEHPRPGPVVIVGSDIPEITPGRIAEAFSALGRCDAVFGPAEDGGYWLAGLRRRPRTPRIFGGVRWSGPHALADTLANCGGLSVDMLERLADVDTAEAWARWRRRSG